MQKAAERNFLPKEPHTKDRDPLPLHRFDRRARGEGAEIPARYPSGRRHRIPDRKCRINKKWGVDNLDLFGLSNKRGEGHIPDDILRDLARLLLPQIIQMYESEEGKKQFAEWKAEQEKQKEIVAAESKSEGTPSLFCRRNDLLCVFIQLIKHCLKPRMIANGVITVMLQTIQFIITV